jgi:hypothetical protein
MEKLRKMFKNTKDLEPSAGLEGFILAKIEAIGSKKTQKRLVFSYAGLLGSMVAVFYSVAVFGEGIIRSEFFSLVSLAFSDAAIVAQNWREFSYSLLETFPAVYAAIIIVPISTLFLSFNGYLNNHNHSRHYNAM